VRMMAFGTSITAISGGCTHSLAIGDTLQRGLRQAACV